MYSIVLFKVSETEFHVLRLITGLLWVLTEYFQSSLYVLPVSCFGYVSIGGSHGDRSTLPLNRDSANRQRSVISWITMRFNYQMYHVYADCTVYTLSTVFSELTLFDYWSILWHVFYFQGYKDEINLSLLLLYVIVNMKQLVSVLWY